MSLDIERRFSEDFGRRVYRKTNIVSENHNENVDIEVNDADKIREKILEKFDRVGESNGVLTSYNFLYKLGPFLMGNIALLIFIS